VSEQPKIEPGSLPVEELPDVSWQRIERKLFSRLASEAAAGGPAPAPARTPRRRRWLVAGGLAAAAAAVLAVLVLRGGGDGDGDGDDTAAIRSPVEPRAPQRIATTEAPSAVSVGDVSLEIAPHSALLVDEDRDRALLFVLERGEATFRVAPVGDRPPIVVQAGDVRIEVIGTAFAVSRQGDSARVLVYEGVVSLLHRGERTRVTAGSVWPEAPVAPPTVQPSAPPPPAAKRMKQPPAERRPDAPLAAPPLTDKDRYRRAQELEQKAPERARALYRELVGRGGAWAPMALYAHALLEDRLGDPRAARRLLEQYLSRYPDGLNAADARELLKASSDK
jgi:hypothetical protein